MVRLNEKLSEEANRKWPMRRRMVMWPMTSRDPERVKIMNQIGFESNISKTAADAI